MQVFEDGFPEDFSILATFRTSHSTSSGGKKGRNKATLFSIYSSEGLEVLRIEVLSRRIRLEYQGILSGGKKRKIKFRARRSDSK